MLLMKQILPRNPFFDIDHKKIITDTFCLYGFRLSVKKLTLYRL